MAAAQSCSVAARTLSEASTRRSNRKVINLIHADDAALTQSQTLRPFYSPPLSERLSEFLDQSTNSFFLETPRSPSMVSDGVGTRIKPSHRRTCCSNARRNVERSL